MNLGQLIRHLKAEQAQREAAGQRTFRLGDPGKGIEYNSINPTHLVSKALWKVDIARTPQVIRDLTECVDVHHEAWVINQYNCMMHYRDHKVKGR